MKPLLSNNLRKLCSQTGSPLFYVPLCTYAGWKTNGIEDEDGAEETDDVVIRIT